MSLPAERPRLASSANSDREGRGGTPVPVVATLGCRQSYGNTSAGPICIDVAAAVAAALKVMSWVLDSLAATVTC